MLVELADRIPFEILSVLIDVFVFMFVALAFIGMGLSYLKYKGEHSSNRQDSVQEQQHLDESTEQINIDQPVDEQPPVSGKSYFFPWLRNWLADFSTEIVGFVLTAVLLGSLVAVFDRESEIRERLLRELRSDDPAIARSAAEELVSEGMHADGTLHGQSLGEALLMETRLEYADFTGANLWRADFSRSRLNSAIFNGANLNGTVFQDACMHGAQIRFANLTDAILSGVTLTGANFEGANLTRANLDGANLIGANLTDAIVADVDCDEKTRLPDDTECPIDESVRAQVLESFANGERSAPASFFQTTNCPG